MYVGLRVSFQIIYDFWYQGAYHTLHYQYYYDIWVKYFRVFEARKFVKCLINFLSISKAYETGLYAQKLANFGPGLNPWLSRYFKTVHCCVEG